MQIYLFCSIKFSSSIFSCRIFLALRFTDFSWSVATWKEASAGPNWQGNKLRNFVNAYLVFFTSIFQISLIHGWNRIEGEKKEHCNGTTPSFHICEPVSEIERIHRTDSNDGQTKPESDFAKVIRVSRIFPQSFPANTLVSCSVV